MFRKGDISVQPRACRSNTDLIDMIVARPANDEGGQQTMRGDNMKRERPRPAVLSCNCNTWQLLCNKGRLVEYQCDYTLNGLIGTSKSLCMLT